jgi:DNA-binding SARP family transcriptional activator
MAPDIEFDLLGTLRMKADVITHVPRGPKINKILALLLLRANQIVAVDTLVDELWEENPPRHAISTVRTHIYHLRLLMTRHLGVPGDDLVVTQPPGYLLVVDRQQIDAVRFTALAHDGRRLLGQGRSIEALTTARAGLRLWRGAALANVPTGRVLGGHVQRLDELRIQTLSVRIEAKMNLGRHRELIPELRDLVAGYPLNEWFHACLIEVLRRTGRRADALRAFQELRATLDKELGLEPSASLRNLQHSILLGEDPGKSGRTMALDSAS